MVLGYIGNHLVSFNIARQASDWTLNRTVVPGLEQLDDLDLSFTPATNLLQLRRQEVPCGKSVSIPVAWLDIDTGALTKLLQFYERCGTSTFWYRAPTAGYEGMLELAPDGFIQNYPDLWKMRTADAATVITMGTPSPELCNLWHARAFLKDIGLHRSEISW